MWVITSFLYGLTGYSASLLGSAIILRSLMRAILFTGPMVNVLRSIQTLVSLSFPVRVTRATRVEPLIW